MVILTRQFAPLRGGAERQAERLAASLASQGLTVRVLTERRNPAWSAHERVKGFEVIRLSAPRIRGLGSAVFLAKLAWWFLRNASRFDLIHAFMLKPEALAALLAAKVLGKPLVLRPSGSAKIGDIGSAGRRFGGRLTVDFLRLADAFVAISRDLADEMARAGFPRAKIHLIPTGVPVPEDQAKPENATVIFVGRLAPEKNLDVLLAAWKRVSERFGEARLDICGEGPLRRELEGLTLELGLKESVRFRGFVEDIYGVLARKGIFVLPSASEGMSAALAEAMASGLAVVSTDVSGSRDLIRDGHNGYLVPAADEKALADRLILLLGNENLRLKMGAAARETALNFLEESRIAAAHEDLYRHLLRRSKRKNKSQKRLVHVIATLDAGGSERQMALLLKYLGDSSFEREVICLTRKGPVEEELSRIGVVARVVGKRGKLDIGALLRLRSMLAGGKADIVHTWLFTANAYGRLAAVAARVPGLFASERSIDPWKNALHAAIDRLLALTTDKIFANSQAVMRALQKRGVGGEKLLLVPNIVEPAQNVSIEELSALKQSLGIPPNAAIVGYVGRLSPEKGVKNLLNVHAEVRSQLPNTFLVLLGEGPEKRELARMNLAERGIILAGYSSRPGPYYRIFDVVVLLSEYEGMPNSLLEALAHARPAVAFAVGGIEELARSSRGVVPVAPGDWKAAAREIVRLLCDAEKRREMGDKGLEYVLKEHSGAHVARVVRDSYLGTGA